MADPFTLASLGIGLAGNVIGRIGAARKARKAAQELARQRRKNQSIYDREQYADATQRADAQRLLTQTNEAIRKRNRAAEGVRAVMGGTEESVARTKEANNNLYADTVSRINAQGETRKDTARRQYIANDNAFSNQQRAADMQEANNIAAAVQGVTGAVGSIAALQGAEKAPRTKEPSGVKTASPIIPSGGAIEMTADGKPKLRSGMGGFLGNLLSGNY